MTTDFILQWKGSALSELQSVTVTLFPYSDFLAGQSLSGQAKQDQHSFSIPEFGMYLLELEYTFQNQRFSSCYFQFDYPDITLIEVQHLPQGCQIERMGFMDDQGQFIDMLIYEGQKPFLTFPTAPESLHERLGHFLVYEYKHLDMPTFRQHLHQFLPDLSLAYPTLEKLWHYQIKLLVDQGFLAKTTPEWKACLFQLVRSNLILMDNENLFEILSSAVDLAQQNERVAYLLGLMEWDVDQKCWANYPLFLKELSGKGVLKG